MGYAVTSRKFNESRQFTLFDLGDGTTEIQFPRNTWGAGSDSEVLYRNKIDVTNIKYFHLKTIGRKDADAGSNWNLALLVNNVSRGASVWSDAVENPQELQVSAGATGVQEVKLKFSVSDADNLLLKFVKCWYVMEEI